MRARLKSAGPVAAVLAVALLLSGCHYYYPYGYGAYGHHGGHGHGHGRGMGRRGHY